MPGDDDMKKRYIIAGVAAGAAAITCAAIGIRSYLQEKSAGSGYEEVREEVKDNTPEEPEPEETGPTVDIPIDFEALQARNPDVYAWITVPGTQIDYPILQSPDDNSYYLTHTIDGEEKTEGAIFTENYNHTDMEDPNTVIYGHDMKNGSMFNGLHQFADSGFFEEHPYIYIYTPEHVLAYKVFAAYTYDDRHIMNSFDFTDKEVFEQYLDDIIHVRAMDANLREDVPVTSDDRIITLETCVGGNSDARYLVQGVLIKDGSNEQ